MLRHALPLALLLACHPQGDRSTAPDPDTKAQLDPSKDGARQDAKPSVSAARMLETIAHLADDKLLGRYTLAPEIHQAADFLAKRYADAGLVAVADQHVVPYSLTVGAKLRGEQKFVAHPARGRARPFPASAFTPLPSSASGKIRAEAVFVGYGATSDPNEDGSVAYDDLEGIDLEGKIAVVFTDAPNTPDFRAMFELFGRIGEEFSHDAKAAITSKDEHKMRELHKRARDRMAVALKPFMRGEPLPKDFWDINDPMVAELDIFSMLGPIMRKAQEFKGPRFSRGARLSAKLRRLSAAKAAGVVVVRAPASFIEAEAREADALPELLPEPARVMGEAQAIPVVQLRWHEARDLFKAGRMNLEKTQAKIDKTLTPLSRPMNVQLEIEATIDPVKVEVPNVLAKIPGGDLADEVVLFGAHFDHIGSVGKGDCNRIDKTNDDICNGADDNASGTSMIVEIARAISESGYKPRRTLMFASFSGEEMGLLGSEAMAENPPFDRSQVVAMVNLDMVGRLSVKGLAVGGISSSDQWMPMLDEIGPKDMEVTYERSITSRSDHANWFAHEIPVLFFFTGVHSDYHRAGDHTDEINQDGMQSIGDLVMDLALNLADGAQIKYREPGENEGLVGRLPGSDESTIEKKVEKVEKVEKAAAK